jgi:hypothetical protein
MIDLRSKSRPPQLDALPHRDAVAEKLARTGGRRAAAAAS